MGLNEFKKYLSQRSEIVFLAPAIPCFINLGLSLATAAIYNLEGAHYLECKNKLPSDDENLDKYLSGTIIIKYIFLLFYSNILLEFYTPITDIIISFILVLLYVIMEIIWSALGASWLNSSKCSSTQYYHLSKSNILLGFISVLIFTSLSILKLTLSRGNQVQPLETKNEAEENAEEKPGEENIENMLEDAPIDKNEGNNPGNNENEKESTEKSGTPIPNSELKNNVQDKTETKGQNKEDDLDELLKETGLLDNNKNNGNVSNTKDLSSTQKESKKTPVTQASVDHKNNNKPNEKDQKRKEVELEDDDDDEEKEDEDDDQKAEKEDGGEDEDEDEEEEEEEDDDDDDA